VTCVHCQPGGPSNRGTTTCTCPLICICLVAPPDGTEPHPDFADATPIGLPSVATIGSAFGGVPRAPAAPTTTISPAATVV